jgi:hypothetical protein
VKSSPMALSLQHLSPKEAARMAQSTDRQAEELPAGVLLEALAVLPAYRARRTLETCCPPSALRMMQKVARVSVERLTNISYIE